MESCVCLKLVALMAYFACLVTKTASKATGWAMLFQGTIPWE